MAEPELEAKTSWTSCVSVNSIHYTLSDAWLPSFPSRRRARAGAGLPHRFASFRVFSSLLRKAKPSHRRKRPRLAFFERRLLV